MASGIQHPLGNSPGPPPPPTSMSPSYHFCLKAMRQNSTRAGSPGKIIPAYHLPVDHQRHEVDFVVRENDAVFESHDSHPNEDKNIKARFGECWQSCPIRYQGSLANDTAVCQGTQLMLEPHTPQVYVESPPSNDLPRQTGFDRIAIEMSGAKFQRVIYLRPGDTVFLEGDGCHIMILAMEIKSLAVDDASQDDQLASTNEVQVKSSIQQQGGTILGVPEDDEATYGDDDDDDDLDVTVATPSNEEAMPATLDPPNAAIKETPSRPVTGDSNPMFSAAPDKPDAQYAADGTNHPDTSTPAARAGALKSKRESMQPPDDAASQDMFPPKHQRTYGRGTPKVKRQSPTGIDDSEIPERHGVSPGPPGEDDAALDTFLGETQSSPPKRKRPMDDKDKSDDLIPASTAPAVKRPRGRPDKASKSINRASTENSVPAPTNTGKPLGRPSKAFKAAQRSDNAAQHSPSSGKLRRPSRRSGAHHEEEEDDKKGSDQEESATARSRRGKSSPDLNPRPSSTPQSSGTPMTGKAPTKIFLSNSKFAEDRKAKSWLSKQGATIGGDAIPGKRANFICVVGSGELATTAKVLRSLALGKKVVTDQWIEDSMKRDHLLELDGYIHDDLSETADIDRGKLFEGKILFITDAQTKAYGSGIDSIRELAAAVGAWKVESGSAKKASSMSPASTIFLGGDGNDHDAWLLAEEEGRTVYQKALLTQSVIRGELLVNEEELKWKPTSNTGKIGRKG